MLVLSRKINESIIIGDDVEVKIVAIEKDHVKFGISAPQHVSIYRKELYDDIQQENVLAALYDRDDPSSIKRRITIKRNSDG